VWYSIPLRSGVGANLKIKTDMKEPCYLCGSLESWPIDGKTVCHDCLERHKRIIAGEEKNPKKINSFTKSLKNQLAAKNRKQ